MHFASISYYRLEGMIVKKSLNFKERQGTPKFASVIKLNLWCSFHKTKLLLKKSFYMHEFVCKTLHARKNIDLTQNLIAAFGIFSLSFLLLARLTTVPKQNNVDLLDKMTLSTRKDAIKSINRCYGSYALLRQTITRIILRLICTLRKIWRLPCKIYPDFFRVLAWFFSDL